MVWVGDIYLPLVEEQELSRSREVVKRNYEGFEPSVSEYNPNLNQTSLTFNLNEEFHPEGRSLTEQRDALLSLPDQPPAMNSMGLLNEEGYLAVDSVKFTREPSEDVQPGEVEATYMPADSYITAVMLDGGVAPNNFNVTTTGVVAVPADGTGSFQRNPDTGAVDSIEASYTIQTEDSSFDLLEPEKRQVLVDRQRGDEFDSIDSSSSVRIYDHRDTYNPARWRRVYDRGYSFDGGIAVENGLIRYRFNDPSTGRLHIDWFSGSEWLELASYNIRNTPARVSHLDVYQAEIEFGPDYEHTLQLRRGEFAGIFELTDFGSLVYNLEPSDFHVSSVDEGEHYIVANSETMSARPFLAIPSVNLTLQRESQRLILTGMEPNETYRIPSGAAIPPVPIDKAVEWSFSDHTIEQTLLRRGVAHERVRPGEPSEVHLKGRPADLLGTTGFGLGYFGEKPFGSTDGTALGFGEDYGFEFGGTEREEVGTAPGFGFDFGRDFGGTQTQSPERGQSSYGSGSYGKEVQSN